MRETCYELELALLATLMNGACFDDIATLVSSQDFITPWHRRLFDEIAVRVAADKAIDPVALLDDKVISPNQLSDIARTIFAVPNATLYAKSLRNRAKKRYLRDVLAKGVETLSQPSACDYQQVVSDLQSTIDSLSGDEREDYHTWSQDIHDSLRVLQRLESQRGDVGLMNVPLGLPSLDTQLAGINGPRLIILAARPSNGKTALLQQFALNAAACGKKVGIVTLEMLSYELTLRSFANRYSLSLSDMFRGQNNITQRIQQQCQQSPLSHYGIYTHDGDTNLSVITSRIAQWKRQHAIDVAIVDHVGLVTVDNKLNRNDQLGLISRQLKQLSKRLHIPIIAASQLSRRSEHEKRRPMLSDLRDSGNIEQDADVVMMLHAKPNHRQAATLDMEIGLLKNRCGRRGWLPCHISFDGATQQFREVAA